MIKALALLSGGFDSPVAIDKVKKQGWKVDAVHFHYSPLTDLKSVEKSREICKKLGIKKLFIMPFVKPQTEAVDKCNHRYFYVLTRRIMFRTAEKLAAKEGYKFLVTGENLGQVSSQTLDNLTIIDRAIKMTIVRPLLCLDKNEIIADARELDTYETSKGPEMCSILGPKNPITRAKLELVGEQEKRLDIKKLIDGCLKELEVVEF